MRPISDLKKFEQNVLPQKVSPRKKLKEDEEKSQYFMYYIIRTT